MSCCPNYVLGQWTVFWSFYSLLSIVTISLWGKLKISSQGSTVFSHFPSFLLWSQFRAKCRAIMHVSNMLKTFSFLKWYSIVFKVMKRFLGVIILWTLYGLAGLNYKKIISFPYLIAMVNPDNLRWLIVILISISCTFVLYKNGKNVREVFWMFFKIGDEDLCRN